MSLRTLTLSLAFFAGAISQAGILVPRFVTCEVPAEQFAKLSAKEAKQTPYAIEAYVDLVSPFMQPAPKELTHAVVFEFRNPQKAVIAKAFALAKFDESAQAAGGGLVLTIDANGHPLKLAIDMDKDLGDKKFPATLSAEKSPEKLSYVCTPAPEQQGD